MLDFDELVTVIHTLFELTVQAIAEQRNYDVFVLMFERTKKLTDLAALPMIDMPAILSIREETEMLQELLQTAIERYQNAIRHSIETAPAKRAYGMTARV